MAETDSTETVSALSLLGLGAIRQMLQRRRASHQSIDDSSPVRRDRQTGNIGRIALEFAASSGVTAYAFASLRRILLAMALERVSYIIHRGKRVLVIDISNGCGPEIAEVIAKAAPLIRSSPKNSVLTLTDVKNVVVKDVHVNELVEFVKGNKPYVRAAGVVGVGDLAGAMLATTRILTGRQLKSFGSRREALDWLVGIGQGA